MSIFVLLLRNFIFKYSESYLYSKEKEIMLRLIKKFIKRPRREETESMVVMEYFVCSLQVKTFEELKPKPVLLENRNG